MQPSLSEVDLLLQIDWRDSKLDSLAKGDWITVHSISNSNPGTTAICSALIPNDEIDEFLSETSWGITIEGFLPSCTRYGGSEEGETRYYRYGNDQGIEPLVLIRSFHAVFEPYLEVSEDFRLFHNLYQARDNTYFKITSAGNRHDVIRIVKDVVSIRTKELRQFLAIKEMHLALLIEVTRFSSISIDTIPENQRFADVYDGLTHFTFHVSSSDWSSNSSQRTFSRLLGKRLLSGFSKEKSGMWPYDQAEPKTFESFTIGVNDDGEAIRYTSNPDSLANYFGANPESPDYLTPVFFDREVLTKYYAQPEKYSVEDGYLRCGGLWGLRLDNDHTKHIIVYLGDLGRDLPSEEQLYWKSYNILPDGNVSQTNFRRSFLAEFADPVNVDLTFKTTFNDFQSKWESKYRWYLLLPLTEDDEHLLNSLRIPLTNDQSEFDYQVLALTKILIDSINEAELSKIIGEASKEMKGIAKLSEFLKIHQLPQYDIHIKFLRDLQSLRSSSVGHRKGSDYIKIARKMGFEEKDLATIFHDLLIQGTTLLVALQQHFLNQPKDEN
ncbi:hypothetical protein EYB53_013440 [Candidatus Chloroploca sp. M-50]|uniref:ApeA N-terminal domain-containing protein n=1 Tax=Candidatus Chloroploca mongolica TaxID=2528176 RepID=A0ABS4DB88_9CHLR|nr:hypothetical protein [Candidatus Chloroploca mongolica]MBP1466714.1 hypothetical protein [Candidatus Chloroploca mongolica]